MEGLGSHEVLNSSGTQPCKAVSPTPYALNPDTGNGNIGAKIVTKSVLGGLGVPDYNYSIMDPKTQF